MTVHRPFLPAKVFLLEEGRAYCFGRDPACELYLDEERISRRHARLEWDGTQWRVEDLGSKNGITLAGEKVSRAPLASGAWLSLGGVVAQFEVFEPGWDRQQMESLASWRENSTGFVRDLDPAKGLEHLLGKLMESLLRLSGAERGFILLVSPDGKLELARVAPAGLPELESGFTGSLGAVERALETARPVVVSDAQSDAFLASRSSIVEGFIRNLVCLPLQVSGRVIGVVYADGRKAGGSFTELDVEMLEALVGQAALALWAARLDEELRRLAGRLPALGPSDAPTPTPDGPQGELAAAAARMYVAYVPEGRDASSSQEGRLQRAWTGMVRAFRDKRPK